MVDVTQIPTFGLNCRCCGQGAPSPPPLEGCPNCGENDWQRPTSGFRRGLLFAVVLAVVGVASLVAFWSGQEGVTPPGEGTKIEQESEDDSFTAVREVDSWRRRGRQAAQEGRHQRARDSFAQAARLAPDDALSWSELAAAEGALGRAREAHLAYEKALTHDPDLWLAHYNLALLLAREGRVDRVCEHLGRGLAALRREQSPYLSQVLKDLESNDDFNPIRKASCFRALSKRT